ncbi:cytochrome P450 2C39-like isoform X3 [Hypanus sabinus]|uniref:cytochrome P450 2C39-like isoform X3 n=1 Tax=Hypanus sabinus TaxID=79690 RepID=UPI0028C3C116|nr:cytochrome P450 2C39-like isoform X3 [Hypanus sabinus]
MFSTNKTIENCNDLQRLTVPNHLCKLSERYGPVFTFWFGSCPAVVVCGAEAMREALIDHGYDFSGRYLLPAIKKISDGYGINFSSGERWKQLRRFTLSTLRNFGMGKKSAEERIQEEAQFLVTSFMDKKGVGFSSGERWKQLRRFTLSTLRNFGMGKKSGEERIQEEAQFLVTSFRDKKDEPFIPNFLLRCAMSNNICSITFGKRCDYEDKQFLWLTEIVAEIARSLCSPSIQLYNTFPRIMDFLPGPHQKFFQNIKNLRNFLARTIQSHKETVQKDSPRDYIDCFLTKMDEMSLTPNSFTRTCWCRQRACFWLELKQPVQPCAGLFKSWQSIRKFKVMVFLYTQSIHLHCTSKEVCQSFRCHPESPQTPKELEALHSLQLHFPVQVRSSEIVTARN